MRKLSFLFLFVQKQEDDFNCDAFAIVYTAEILDGKFSIDAQLDEPKMRSHLLSYLVERDLFPFPKVK